LKNSKITVTSVAKKWLTEQQKERSILFNTSVEELIVDKYQAVYERATGN